MSLGIKNDVKRYTKGLNELLNSSSSIKTNYNPDPTLDTSLNASSIAIASVRLDLEAYLESLKEITQKLDKSISNWSIFIASQAADKNAEEKGLSDLDDTLKFYDAVEAGYKKVRDLERSLVALKTKEDETNLQSSVEEKKKLDITESTFRANIPPSASIKLPPLEIPYFHGGKEEFITFWDCFNAGIHSNDSLQPVQKFTHLLSRLKGEAYKVVVGIKLTDDNYKVAREALEDEYGDTSSLVRDLRLELNNLEKCHNWKDVRNFHMTVSRIQRQLKNLNHLIEDPQVWTILERKLTLPVIERLWDMRREHEETHDWNTTALLLNLKKIIDRGEQIHAIAGKQNNREEHKHKSDNKGNKHTQHDDKGPSSSMYAVVGDSRPPSGKPFSRIPVCLLCGSEEHRASGCKTYQTIDARRKRFEAMGRCLKCLKASHKINDCPTSIQCALCAGPHVACLCPSQNQQQRSSSSNHTQSNKKKSFGGKGWQDVSPKPQNPESQKKKGSGRERLRSASAPPKQNPQQQKSNNNNRMHSVIDTTDCDKQENGKVLMMATHKGQIDAVLLWHTEAMVYNPDKPSIKRKAVVFIDPGCQSEFISDELAESLQLRRSRHRIATIFNFANTEPIRFPTSDVEFGIETSSGDDLRMVANTSGTLTTETPMALLTEAEAAKIAASTGMTQIPIHTRKPDITIGNRWFFRLGLRPIRKLDSGFMLATTVIGPIVCSEGQLDIGSKKVAASTIRAFSVIQPCNELKSLGEKVDEYFESEKAGMQDNEADPIEKEVLKHHVETLVFENNRYQVSLPWIDAAPKLSTNFGLAFGRLNSTLPSLLKRPDILEKYDACIREQLEKGIIELVERPNESQGLIHYLPHHPVITSKVRIVYDGSARCGKGALSLNDCLHGGPSTINDLAGMLLRWRKHRIAITSDLEKAFLMIDVRPEDRDVLRFLWVKDLNQPLCSENLAVFRFRRVPFGVISSPFLLGATVAEHLKKYPGELASEISTNIYVDNLILGAESLREALDKCIEAKKIFAEASWNLREFNSNCTQVIENLPVDDRSPDATVEASSSDGPKRQKVLGIYWDTKKDLIGIKIPQFSTEGRKSKRIVLSNIASVFDPHGLLSPALLPLKQFFQCLWEKQYNWDDKLPDDGAERWETLLKGWQEIDFIEFPRRAILSGNEVEYELHGFSDASKDAYAAVVFVRSARSEEVMFRPVFAKSKVRPTKSEVSIPRMELMAAEVGSRILGFVQKQIEIPVNRFVLWVDSQCILHQLKDPHRHKEKFVQNRLEKVRKIPDLVVKYIPTDDNPADVASRGTDPISLISHRLWWEGPEWIREEYDQWPNVLEYVHGEELTHHSAFSESEIMCAVIENPEKEDAAARFSTWTRAVRAIAIWIRYSHRLREVKTNSADERKAILDTYEALKNGKKFSSFAPIRVEDSEQAEVYLLRSAQAAFPPDDSTSANLNLGKDKFGLWRCRGRIEKSAASEEAKLPILLPKKSVAAKLIIVDQHLKAHHTGALTTLALLREKFWMVAGRRTVSDVLRRECRICKRYNAKSYKIPAEAQLPANRVTSGRPFEAIGLDYFGPLTVRRDEIRVKRWVSIFTCMRTRAIHLELVDTYDAESFLTVFRRFVSRRGMPSEITSDHGTNFKPAAKAILERWEQVADDPSVQKYLVDNHVRWHLITERAPWRGGFYERLIKIVKDSLRKTIGRRLLKEGVMITLLLEIEATVNARPITFMSDQFESPQPLRPIDFLCPGKHATQIDPPPAIEGLDAEMYKPDSRDLLLATWEKSLRILDKFWLEWHQQYLLSLRERDARVHGRASSLEPGKGDVVLVSDEENPRGKWQLGRVVELVQSRDGIIRSAKVLTISPTGRKETLTRAANHLFPLEVNDKEISKEEISNEDIIENLHTARSPPRLRPKPHRLYQTIAACVISAMPDLEYDLPDWLKLPRPLPRERIYSEAREAAFRIESLPEEDRRAIGIDTESLGGRGGSSMLGQVGLVDIRGNVVYRSYVLWDASLISDYRTPWSGLTAEKIASGRPFDEVRDEVLRLVNGRRLVGLDIGQEMKALHMFGDVHPYHSRVDVQSNALLNQLIRIGDPIYAEGIQNRPGLQRSYELLFGYADWQQHDAELDARATMRLYRALRDLQRDRERGVPLPISKPLDMWMAPIDHRMMLSRPPTRRLPQGVRAGGDGRILKAEPVPSVDGTCTLVGFFSRRYVFSNHYMREPRDPILFTFDNYPMTCSEMAYMTWKALFNWDFQRAILVMQEGHAGSIKRIGNRIRVWSEEHWRPVSVFLMTLINLEKYRQNRDLRQALFDTEGATLVECSDTDDFWGVRRSLRDVDWQNPQKWRGDDALGRILTAIREKFAFVDFSQEVDTAHWRRVTPAAPPKRFYDVDIDRIIAECFVRYDEAHRSRRLLQEVLVDFVRRVEGDQPTFDRRLRYHRRAFPSVVQTARERTLSPPPARRARVEEPAGVNVLPAGTTWKKSVEVPPVASIPPGSSWRRSSDSSWRGGIMAPALVEQPTSSRAPIAAASTTPAFTGMGTFEKSHQLELEGPGRLLITSNTSTGWEFLGACRPGVGLHKHCKPVSIRDVLGDYRGRFWNEKDEESRAIYLRTYGDVPLVSLRNVLLVASALVNVRPRGAPGERIKEFFCCLRRGQDPCEAFDRIFAVDFPIVEGKTINPWARASLDFAVHLWSRFCDLAHSSMVDWAWWPVVSAQSLPPQQIPRLGEFEESANLELERALTRIRFEKVLPQDASFVRVNWLVLSDEASVQSLDAFTLASSFVVSAPTAENIMKRLESLIISHHTGVFLLWGASSLNSGRPLRAICDEFNWLCHEVRSYYPAATIVIVPPFNQFSRSDAWLSYTHHLRTFDAQDADTEDGFAEVAPISLTSMNAVVDWLAQKGWNIEWRDPVRPAEIWRTRRSSYS